MYVIAVCDDEEKELDEIESFLARYQEKNKEAEFKMERFTSGEALVQRAREENYTPDILLLDIFMPGKTGIEAAEDMRELGFSMPIVFFTTSTEYALKAYGVDAVQYLVKPLGQECFFHGFCHPAGFQEKGEPDCSENFRGSQADLARRYHLL